MLKWLTMCLLTIASLYFIFGSWLKADITIDINNLVAKKESQSKPFEYNGVVYRNAAEMAVAIREENVPALWSWFGHVPYLFAVIMLAASCGALGGVAKIIRVLAFDSSGDKMITSRVAIATPLFGAVVGLLLLSVAYLVPAALTVQQEMYTRPTAVLFLALLGGLFADKAFLWIERSTDAIFHPPPKTGGSP
jgi:hypothetical protein